MSPPPALPTNGPGVLPTNRWHAPRHSGQALIDPPRNQVASRLAENRELLACRTLDLHGRWLVELSRMARGELLRKAWEYTSQYRNPGPPPTDPLQGPLLLSGHQPQLFHAGVWFKNFLLSALATRHGATAINLIIDNDTCRTAAIRVPTGTPDDPRLLTLAYDEPSDIVPYEERLVKDRERFASFAGRTASAIRGLIGQPLVERLWEHAERAFESTDNLGRVLARARNSLEAEWGLNNWELPLGELCRGLPFRWFALHLLADAERFAMVYNTCLASYRRLNRIRSRSHPVPALVSDDGWQEAPFWIWDTQRPLRRGLFVRRTAAGWELGDRQSLRRQVAITGEGDLSTAVEQLDEWEQQGVKLRPRALLTTMYARLLLSDLFVHGIGGARYDELTDDIVRNYFGVTPPYYLVATATLCLPVPRVDDDAEQRLRELDQQVRAMQFHPERYLVERPEARAWMETKQRWIETQLPRGERRPRHLAIEQSNMAMQAFLEQQRHDCQSRRQQLSDEVRRQHLLSSREFAFCLFPSKTLRDNLLELSFQEP